MITSRQAFETVVGLTQASGSSHASTGAKPSRGSSPRELAPLKLSAPPFFPVAVQGVCAAVPLLPLPDAPLQPP